MTEPTDAPLVRVDAPAHRAWLGEKPLDLPRLQMRLLIFLTCNADRAITHEEILREVWGTNWGTGKSTQMYISRLRQAFGDDVARPRYITTVNAVGYRFEAAMLHPDSVFTAHRVDVNRLAETLAEGLTELRHMQDAALKHVEPREMAVRGDAVEGWLAAALDVCEPGTTTRLTIEALLEDYWRHADLGIPLIEPLPVEGAT